MINDYELQRISTDKTVGVYLMKVLDLFSGIGGFSLGLERAGMKTVAFCEIDPFCQKILKKHWPDVPIHTDITKLDGKQYAGAIDLVCGGFPCQPFSFAGKRKGKIDNRHLWPEMFRVVQESKPTWFLGENVPGIINMELEQVCTDLEAEGYEVQPLIIPACGVDAPHRRNRVWILAHSNFCNDNRISRQNEGAGKKEQIQERNKYRQFGNASDLCASTVANPDSTGLQRGNVKEGSYKKNGGIQQGRELERNCAAGRSKQWDVESCMDRVANGIPRRVDRLRALGNAVVPQIPEIIGNYMMRIQNL